MTRPSSPSRVAAGWVWPAERGREVLDRVAKVASEIDRTDLVGVPGSRDGSGSSDLLIRQAEGFCLKTSRRRRFDDVEEARAAMLVLARRKVALGALVPPDTTLCLSRDEEGKVWLWTISRWLTTLRASMTEAAHLGEEVLLANHLRAFAFAAFDALALTASLGLVLDVHPSNFGTNEAGTFYLDDDVATGVQNLAIGHALLQRVEEYAAFSGAVHAFVRTIEQLIADRIDAATAEKLGLARCFETTFVRSEAAQLARLKLLHALGRNRRAARP